MAKILRGQELEDFIKENKLACNSIILKIDENKKEAQYIVDGEIIVKCDYELAKKYF